MIPGIKTIWVLTCMTLQIVDKPINLAMKIMVLTAQKNVSHDIYILRVGWK
jgi:hypothetical protein